MRFVYILHRSLPSATVWISDLSEDAGNAEVSGQGCFPCLWGHQAWSIAWYRHVLRRAASTAGGSAGHARRARRATHTFSVEEGESGHPGVRAQRCAGWVPSLLPACLCQVSRSVHSHWEGRRRGFELGPGRLVQHSLRTRLPELWAPDF